MKTYEYQAVVIGTGCAGYNCADWLYDLGVKNIAILTEDREAGTSRNTGSDKQTYYKMSLAGDEGDSPLQMAQTLFDGGAMDGDVALAEASNSVRSFIKLANLGVNFPTNEYGEFAGYKTDHDPYRRATSVGPYTSKRMTEVLEKSVFSKNITVHDGLMAVKLLTDENGICGVLAVNTKNTDEVEYVAVKTPYVVLATGGPAGIYYDSVYPIGHLGSSSLAIRAGAEMVNLSEWQYGLASIDFRWNVSGTYQQVLPRYISVDENGVEREFLLDYMRSSEMLKSIFLKGYEWPFDVRKIHGSSYVDLIVYNESVIKGRKVYMDFTREPSGLENGFESLDETAYEYLKNSDALIPLPINRLLKMNPGAVDLYREHGIDLTKEPLRIAVCAQHNNGGVRINADWETCVPGLYVIGEAAGSLGVFRPGGTALNSCQVGGMRAARSIAYKSRRENSARFYILLSLAVEETDRMIRATKSTETTLSKQRKAYQQNMSKCFAFLRKKDEMAQGKQIIEDQLKSFFKDNKWMTVKQIPYLLHNYDILLTQQAVALSMMEAAEKCGSRGSAFVCDGDFMKRSPISENTAMRSRVITVQMKHETLQTNEYDVRPIPDRDLWFERVWGEHRRLTRE